VLPEDGPLHSRLQEIGIHVSIHKRLSIITRKIKSPLQLLIFLLNYPLSVFWLWRFIKKYQIRIVHTNTGVIASSGLAAKLAGVMHVWHIRDWFQEFSFIWKYYSRFIEYTSQAIICVSGPIAEQFNPSQKKVVVNNGFPLEEFPLHFNDGVKKFQEQYKLENKIVIGTVGRIKFLRKGQEVLVNAAKILKGRGIHLKYLIVGSPFSGNEDHLDRLKKLIDDNDLTDDFVLTGELEDVRPAYSAMKVFILPSGQPEPFGGVVMEAMAMGLPVIATNIGGSIEQVDDGVSGYLVPPNNELALADKIQTIITDNHLREKMGREGRRRIETIFTIKAMADKIENVYSSLLG
jgi:glycosyltransferase involved in cell wall biosynthesis